MNMLKCIKNAMLLFVTVLSMVAITSCAPADDQVIGNDRKIFIATGGTAGTYYPIGAAITAIITKYVPGVDAIAESSSASIANLDLLKDGKVDFILVASNTAHAAYKGYEPFSEPYDDLRAVATLYPEVFHFVVLKDSSMTNLYDLKGKRVVVGEMNSGTYRTAKELLKFHGISFDDILPQYLSFSEGVEALKSDKADCVIVGSGIPTTAIVDISAVMDINLLSVDVDALPQNETSEYLETFTIPEGTYRGVNRDVVTVASPAILATTKSKDDNLVYQILEAMFRHVDEIESAHPQGRNIKLENTLQNKSIPLHNGTKKYFETKFNRL